MFLILGFKDFLEEKELDCSLWLKYKIRKLPESRSAAGVIALSPEVSEGLTAQPLAQLQLPGSAKSPVYGLVELWFFASLLLSSTISSYHS